MYERELAFQPTHLDVTGLSIEEVGEQIDAVIEAAWDAPRQSDTKTLW